MPVRSVWSSTHWAQESCVEPAFCAGVPVHRLSFRALAVGTRARAHRTRKGVRGSTPLPRQISSCCMAPANALQEQLRAFSRISRSMKNAPTKYSSTLFPDDRSDQVIRENPASRGTETSAEDLVGPPGRMVSNAGQQQWYGGYPCTLDGGPMGHSVRSTAPPPHPPLQSASEGIGGARGLGNLVRPESHPEPRGFSVQWADTGIKPERLSVIMRSERY